MNVDSLSPFLLLITPILVAIFLEAVVMFFCRLQTFWACVGHSFLINLLVLAILYPVSAGIAKLGYHFDSLQLPLQVFFAFCWVSVIADALLLKALVKRDWVSTCKASLVMNLFSYSFLFVFLFYSH